MGAFRRSLARTRRVWLGLFGAGLLVGSLRIVVSDWNDEAASSDAWIGVSLWAIVVALVTALAYESVRPVSETRARDRAWAGLVHGLAALPLLNLAGAILYASNQPDGVSFDSSLGGFFLLLVYLFLAPALVSSVLVGGLVLAAEAAWKRRLYWSLAPIVLLIPFGYTLFAGGVVHEQGGGLLVASLTAVLWPAYAKIWRQPGRTRRTEPEHLYPA